MQSWHVLILIGGSLIASSMLHAATPEDQAAIERGRKALDWAQNFACPVMGAPLNVAGLNTEAEIAAAADENWTYANSRLSAIAEAIRARRVIEAEFERNGTKPGNGTKARFAELDDAIAATSARTASALTQWMLAQWAAMSRLDGNLTLVGQAPHPLAPFAQRASELDKLSAGFGTTLTSLPAKFRRCLAEAQGALLDYNAAAIRASASGATTPAELDFLLSRIQIVEPASGTDGAALVMDIRARKSAMQVAAAEVEERRRAAASAELRTRLQRDAETGRGIATRYINAINAGNISAAVGLLHNDVFLVSPQGNAHGKSAVAERMRKAASEGSSTRPQPPQVDGEYRIFSSISSDRGSGRIFFTVRNSLIEQIRLVQN